MTSAGQTRAPAARLLAELFDDVARACDGQRLVAGALRRSPLLPARFPVHVFALGKAAAPMLAGLRAVVADAHLGRGLVVTTFRGAAGVPALPADFRCLTGNHPRPGPASLAAGQAALAFVSGLPAGEPLLVLLSGGGSALACLPALGLDLADKASACAALMAQGASIFELNTLRKHLSDLKGGRLGAAARGPVLVLALSDVVGNDPATIASGPFHADPTTFADALALVRARLPAEALPPAVRRHLEAGTAGQRAETPKPGGAALAHVQHHVLAGPDQVVEAATAAASARGLRPDVLLRNTEAQVTEVAAAFAARLQSPQPGRLTMANGEPRLAVPAGAGRGGRATHLALLMARALAEQTTGSAFLAAGTDDRDGSGDASGAVVDGTTWAAARLAGLDPEGALARFDSATVLGQLGCLVRGPGTSNLLDVALLFDP